MIIEPKWLTWARLQIGTKEIPGPGDNAKIISYFAMAGLYGSPFQDDETPWCAAFVGAALSVAGISGTHSAAARSYEKWKRGKILDIPVLGAIAVLNRKPPKPGLGHVGFVVGADVNFVSLLGGNQSDMVSVAKFDRKRVICFQWPKNDLIRSEWMTPQINAKDVLGGSVV